MYSILIYLEIILYYLQQLYILLPSVQHTDLFRNHTILFTTVIYFYPVYSILIYLEIILYYLQQLYTFTQCTAY